MNKVMKRFILLLIIAMQFSACSVDVDEFKRAVEQGNIEFIKDNICDIPKDKEFDIKRSALSLSIEQRKWEVASYLIDQGASGSTYALCKALKDKDGENIALQMIKADDELGIETYYDENMYDGATPLQYALSYRKEKAALLLLKKQANPFYYGTHFLAPVFIAAEINAQEVMRLLINKYNKSQDIVDMVASDGTTPLYYAIKDNNIDMITLLLNSGADLSKIPQDKLNTVVYLSKPHVKLFIEQKMKDRENY